MPIAYQKRQCNEYLKLGLQGVSFLFASGDSGVGGKLNMALKPPWYRETGSDSPVFRLSGPLRFQRENRLYRKEGQRFQSYLAE